MINCRCVKRFARRSDPRNASGTICETVKNAARNPTMPPKIYCSFRRMGEVVGSVAITRTKKRKVPSRTIWIGLDAANKTKAVEKERMEEKTSGSFR